MKLTITNVDIADFGMYKCLAKNSLGETDGSIKLYRKYLSISKEKKKATKTEVMSQFHRK